MDPMKPAICMIPPIKKTLIGRRREIEDLQALFHDASDDPEPRYVAIRGMPGVGKTELALHFAHKCLSIHPLDELPLIIFDGLEYEELRGELIRVDQVSVLTTTRSSRIAQKLHMDHIEIEPFETADTIGMICLLMDLSQYADKSILRSELEVAKRLLDDIGGLPIIIEAIAKQCNLAGVGLSGLEKQWGRLSQWQGHIVFHEHLRGEIKARFSNSIRDLEPPEFDLLRVLSRTPSENLSLELFRTHHYTDGEWLETPKLEEINAFRNFYNFGEALQSLLESSLIREKKGMIQIHPIVRGLMTNEMKGKGYISYRDFTRAFVHPNMSATIRPFYIQSTGSETTAQRQSKSMRIAAAFEYPALDLSSDCVRLLQLSTRSGGGSIRCKLFTANISDWHNQYDACSYVWGTETLTKQILINGRDFHIFENLFLFLQALQNINRGGRSIFLWVDAICINQASLNERNHQVSLMSSIYSKASRTLAWLGPQTTGTNWYIKYVNRDVDDDWSHPRHYYNSEMVAGDGTRNFIAKVRGEKLCESFIQLMECEYWYRIWTFQELVLARDILLLWGTKTMPWNRFIRFGGRDLLANAETQVRNLDRQRRIRGKISEIEVLHSLRSGFQRPCLSDLIYEVNILGGRRCSQFHDRIYGLIGVTKCKHGLERTILRTVLTILEINQMQLDKLDNMERLTIQLPKVFCAHVDKTQERNIFYTMEETRPEQKVCDAGSRAFESFSGLSTKRIRRHDIVHRLADLPFALVLRPRGGFDSWRYSQDFPKCELRIVGICFPLPHSAHGNRFINSVRKPLESEWLVGLVKTTTSARMQEDFTVKIETNLKFFTSMLIWLDEQKAEFKKGLGAESEQISVVDGFAADHSDERHRTLSPDPDQGTVESNAVTSRERSHGRRLHRIGAVVRLIFQVKVLLAPKGLRLNSSHDRRCRTSTNPLQGHLFLRRRVIRRIYVGLLETVGKRSGLHLYVRDLKDLSLL
ncbi:MAG: hypothetical protein Q9227_007263 [Pyrenula ochraceoflavens]